MENRFIGRKNELAFLEERFSSKKGEFVIIYGRRRIGKTETIHKFCENKNAVFFTCTQTEDLRQLQTFSKILLETKMPASEFLSEFSSWEQAFLSIKNIPSKNSEKKIVVIDEFPYIVRENSEIPSILQKVWDTNLKNENVMLILCGSAMSYIEKEILSEKNPLYGRATGIYKMLSMPYFDSIEFVSKYSVHDKIIVHSILGGIPYYLEKFDDSISVKENICSSILKRGSILYSEPEFLLRQELRAPATYNTIIQTIAYGKTTFNEIQQSTLIEKGKLSVYLKNLIELGILTREFPVLSTNASKQNVQRGIYKLKDLFFRFWYSFVFPNLSLLEFGDYKTIYDNLIENRLDEFCSQPFEEICLDWMKKQNSFQRLPFVCTEIGRWWNKKTEIDILAANSDRTKIISAECKFHKSKIDSRDLKKHIEKDFSEIINDSTQIFFYYFSFSGFSEDAINFAKENSITIISGEHLLKQNLNNLI